MRRGAIDFDLPEPRVLLDANGRPEAVLARERGAAESIIEEFMLLANEAVAHELVRQKLPGLFRVHEAPDEQKMDQFRQLLEALGYRMPKLITPKSLQKVLQHVQGKPEERVVSSALLRSMKQARYAPENLGHFGLASREYTHFTSPIRRYPDLWVHRVLVAQLTGSVSAADRERWRALVQEVAERSSQREREALEAERDSVAVKQAQFMVDKVGEVYEGIVSGVAPYGMYVELPNLIEGLIRVEDLPSDYWRHDGARYRLVGERTKRVFQIGQPVTVRVLRVDVGLRHIDLGLVETSAARAKRKMVRKRQRS
jgi:ribonuclease R